MTTPDPAGGDGGKQDDGAQGAGDREAFRSLLAEVLESPGEVIEDLIAAAAGNSALRREHNGQPPGHYARRT